MFLRYVNTFSRNNDGQSTSLPLRASEMCVIAKQKIVLALVFDKKKELKNLKGCLTSSMVQSAILHVPTLVRIFSL